MYPQARIVGRLRGASFTGNLICVVKNYASGVEAVDAAREAKEASDKAILEAAKAKPHTVDPWDVAEALESSVMTRSVHSAIAASTSPLVSSDILSMSDLRGLLRHPVGVCDQAIGACLRALGWKKVDRATIGDRKCQVWQRGFNGDAIAELRRRASSAASMI